LALFNKWALDPHHYPAIWGAWCQHSSQLSSWNSQFWPRFIQSRCWILREPGRLACPSPTSPLSAAFSLLRTENMNDWLDFLLRASPRPGARAAFPRSPKTVLAARARKAFSPARLRLLRTVSTSPSVYHGSSQQQFVSTRVQNFFSRTFRPPERDLQATPKVVRSFNLKVACGRNIRPIRAVTRGAAKCHGRIIIPVSLDLLRMPRNCIFFCVRQISMRPAGKSGVFSTGAPDPVFSLWNRSGLYNQNQG